MTVRKMSGFMFVSAEQLADSQPLGDALAARLTEWSDPNYVPPKPWEGEPLTPKPVGYQRLIERMEPNWAMTRELIELHGPKPWSVNPDGAVHRWVCEGCEAGGYDWENPDWPCGTTAVIARHLGVSLEDAHG